MKRLLIFGLLLLCGSLRAQTPTYDPYYGIVGAPCGSLTGPGQAPVATTCSSGCTITAGAATVTPVTMTNIAVAQPLLIDRTGTPEYVVPKAVTGTTFTADFTQAHSGAFLIENTFPNTTSTNVGNVGPGPNLWITPASMAGIVPGVQLDIDPNQAPVQSTGVCPGGPDCLTNSANHTKLNLTLSHATVLPNTLRILANGNEVANSSWGFIGPAGTSLQAVYNHDTPFLFSTAHQVVITPAAGADGQAFTANYTYLPSEVVAVKTVTSTSFTVDLKNAHAQGFKILGGYVSLTQISNHWAMCDALNNAFYFAGHTFGVDTNEVTKYPVGNTVVNTTLSINAPAPPTTGPFTPVSMAGITVGKAIEFECKSQHCIPSYPGSPASPNWEAGYVASVDATTFTTVSALTKQHNSGATLKCCRDLPVNTTLAVNAPTAPTNGPFTPVSMTGIVVGAPIEFECDLGGACDNASNNPNWERGFVTSITGTTFYAQRGAPNFGTALQKQHNAGATIKCCNANAVVASKYDPVKGLGNQTYNVYNSGRHRRAGYNGTAYDVFSASSSFPFSTGVPSAFVDMPTEFWQGSGTNIATNTQKNMAADWVIAGKYSASNSKGFGFDAARDLVKAMPPAYYDTFGSEFLDVFGGEFYSWLEGAMAANYNTSSGGPFASPWTAVIIHDESDEWGQTGVAGTSEDFATLPGGRTGQFGPLGDLMASPLVSASPTTNVHPATFYQSNVNQNKISLRNFLQNRYTTSAALNTAWGTAGFYTTWNSAGNCYGYANICDAGNTFGSESFGTGDGTTTTFNHTLANATVNKNSIQVVASIPGGPSATILGDIPGLTAAPNRAFTGSGTFQGQGLVPAGTTCSNATYCNLTTPGTYAVTPSSMTNILPNSLLIVDSGANQEVVKVTSLYLGIGGSGSPTRFTATFAKAHTPVGWSIASAFSLSSSSINYSTGALSATFTTAPVSGAVLTANYATNGWENGGRGVLDTDDLNCLTTGGGTGWMGNGTTCDTVWFNNSPNGPAGAKPGDGNLTFQADLDDWLVIKAGTYSQGFATVSRTIFPHTLIQTMYGLLGWHTPARPEILAGIAPWIDVLGGSVESPATNSDVAPTRPRLTNTYPSLIGLNRLQYAETQGLGKPIIYQIEMNLAVADSPLFDIPVDTLDRGTQAGKGSYIAGFLNAYFTTPSNINGLTPGIGVIRWNNYESLGVDNCGGCGWFTMNDNQFDGVENTPTPPATDTIGSQTFTLIPELTWPGGNGNSFDSVKNAILGIQNALANSQAGGPTTGVEGGLQGVAKIAGVATIN